MTAAGGRGRRVAIRAMALGLGLLLAEGGLRLFGIAYPAWDRPTAGLGEWGEPNARGWAVGEARQYVELNAEGARDVDHAVAKPEGVHRVVVLGDSYAAAYEVEREQAFWAVAERALAACPALDGRRVEMINLSKRGFGTAEELLVWRKLGAKYAPDQVVLAFYTGNDFRNNSPDLKASGRPYFRIEGGGLVLDESYAEDPAYQRWVGWPGDLWYGLVRHVRLVQVVRHVRRQVKALLETREAQRKAGEGGAGAEAGIDEAIYREPEAPAWESAWTTSERLVGAMRDEVEATGARFVFMTLSTSAQVHPDAAMREATAKRLGVPDLLYPERRFEAFARAQGIHWLSPIPELARAAESSGECVHGFPGPWPCAGHWNATGHRIAGEVLARELCDALREDRIPTAQASSRSPASIERASRP
ncbi:MAG: SGNH/GDSL hydrolase family protein [Deltaproteobacteria bacterium]|nr:SGNH/GDSL hydrolase family protein [Deltaproteobacteria bacterium]